MSNFFGRRRFSSLKGPFHLNAENDSSPPARLKARMQKNSRRNTQLSRGYASESSFDGLEGSAPPRSSKATLKLTSRRPSAKFQPSQDAMPPQEELDEMLERAMEEMAIPKPNREALRSQDNSKKWNIVQMHQNHGPGKKAVGGGTEDLKSAEYWIRKMSDRDSKGRPTITVKDALAMQSVFRTSHKDFLADFIEDFIGVKELNKLTDYFTNLSRRSREESEILQHIIESYRQLMNNEIGMSGVLLVPGSMQSVAMAMDLLGGNDALTEKVILLLSVACWWDEAGRKSVMDAIKFVKVRFRELSCFQTIVYLFEHTEDLAFKASIATFITTVCNTAPTPELRVGVRNHFFRLDIVKIYDKIISRAPERYESTAEEDAWDMIHTQYEVFVAMMRKDQKEIVHKLIRAADADDSHFDLSNLGESWKLLQKNALRADCQDQLLNVVQALFLVPTVSTLAAPIYESIAKYVFEATSVDKLLKSGEERVKLTEPPELNYEELGKLLKRKIEYDAKVEVFAEKEGLVTRQQKLIKILQRRLLDVSKGKIEAKDAMKLQEDLVAGSLLPSPGKSKKNGVAGANGVSSGKAGAAGVASGSKIAIDIELLAGLGLADTANEIGIMKEREENLKKTVEDLQKQVQLLSQGGKLVPAGTPGAGGAGGVVDANDPIAGYKGKLDSTGLVPAGIAPGKTKKDPPPCPKPGMPGSLQNAPIPVESKGPPPLPFVGPGGTLKKGGGPAAGGANKEGGLAALFASRAATMKPKKNEKTDKYKAVLEKLGLPDKPRLKPKVKMTQVFWNVVSPDILEGTIWPELSDQKVIYDQEELEKLFGRTASASKKDVDTKKDTLKPEVIKLIDSQRRQNLAIALRKVNMENEALKQAIVAVDEKVLSPERLEVLLDTAPNEDELTLIQKYSKDGSDPKKLAGEEKYLFEMAQIPNLTTRLRCIKTQYTFVHDAKRIHSKIKKVEDAIAEVKNSSDFKLILEIILAVGNYLNGGTTRGAAWGFKLDILEKIITIKDSVNNGTLMHYLYVLFERNYKQLLEFSMPNCAKVVTISLTETVGEMNTLAKQVQVIKQEIKKKSTLKGDKFKKKLEKFEVIASKDVEGLQKIVEKVRGEFQSLALKYAETGNDVEPSTFFPKIVNFEQGLKRAGVKIVEMRENAARKKEADQKRADRQTIMKIKKLVAATSDEEGNLDMGLIHAFKQSQSGKTNQVVDRFLEKYRRDQERQRKMQKKKMQSKKKQILDA